MIRLIIKHTMGLTGLLFSCALAMAQDGFMDSLQQQFTKYQVEHFQEKIFVHTDKNFYLQGEIIWFKIYTVDESFNRPAGISKVAYVEIINDEQKPVLQAKIALENASGEGSFIVPSSVVSGSYKLRSYTSRMKNFSADYYFEQPLTLVNTLKQSLRKGPPPPTRYHVDFFPEGGNMVDGIPSVIAFKVTDQYGNGINAKGFITSEKKDTAGYIRTLRYGMGSFELTPGRAPAYRAVLTLADTVIEQSLPPVYEQGYTMHLAEDTVTGQLRITVTASSQFLHTRVYLFVHSRQVVKQALAGSIHDNGQAVFLVNRENLADGIAALTVFNAQRQPVCERLYFKRPQHKLLITPGTVKNTYPARSKVTVDLQTTDQAALPVAANMSVAVCMIDSLQPLQYQDIQTWLLLQSELAGKIESAPYYLQPDCSPEAINNLLLTQGWRRFTWDNILKDKPPVFEFITEMEGPVITGTITAKKTGLPLGHIPVTLTVPGEVFGFSSALSRGDGQLYFNPGNFYSGNEFIVQASNPADSAVKIDIDHPFSDKFSLLPFQQFTVDEKWKNQLLTHSINVQAETAFQVDKKRYSFRQESADTLPFYGIPDKQYYLDDYTRFITMEEVLKEFVLEVRVKKQLDKFEFRVVNTAYKNLFENDPLVLIDGLPVYNIDKLMALDPLRIKRIDVTTHRHYLGPLVSDGIVSFKTYQGDLGGYELDPGAIVIEYEGLQRQRTFYSPVYENNEQKESTVPDVRNVLFWSPSVETTADGKQQLSFFTSDLEGGFAIIVQGITAQGLPGSSVTTFRVEK